MLVLAQEGPDVYGTLRRFSRPQRAAPVQRFEVAIPQIFRQRERSAPSALGYAPSNRNFDSLNRMAPERAKRSEFPRGERSEPSKHKTTRGEARRKLRIHADLSTDGGLSQSTNYCVRLCDGFAFPVGNASGNFGIQEATCRQACPGAPTLLYSAPAGAKDFDQLSRNGANYTALPTAFKYREKLDKTCSCNTPGATASAKAVLVDYTLQRGDLVMSNAGFRHFNGARYLPYRVANFSDAIAKLTSKRERAQVIAMETASVRGILSPKAPGYIRNRVVNSVRAAEREALRTASRQKVATNLGRGFTELRAREARGPVTLKVVRRNSGIVALN